MKKILLSAPSGCPGALSALRNHQAILKPFVQCDLIPLEQLISPYFKRTKEFRKFYYRLSKRTEIASVKQILPYGENVILASFGPVHETIIDKLNRKGIRPSFIWCSSIGQLELTPGEYKLFTRLIKLFKKGKIRYFLLPRRLYKSLGHFVKERTFFPYAIDLSQYQNMTKKSLDGINVDVFCRPRFGKNILNQILAFKTTNIAGNIHVNFDIDRFHGIIQLISSKIIRHTWLPIKEYYSLISAMDASLQVTIGESFNYAVCERMAMQVPVLTTPDIYLISEDPILAKYLCVSAPDTPTEIAKSLKHIVTDRLLRKELAEKCKQRIASVAEINNQIVIDQINNLF